MHLICTYMLCVVWCVWAGVGVIGGVSGAEK